MLGGFVDSLLQTFENCRPGLTDAAVHEPSPAPAAVEAYFAALYEKEKVRLTELIALEHAEVPEAARREMVDKIDSRIRGVLIPAYARVARRLTARERNDFYLTASAWHGLERLGFGVAGMLTGLFVVWAPFIPLVAKEWIAVFGLGGLVFPELRRVLALRRYVSEVNGLVERTDDEIFRMDLTLLTREPLPAPAVTPVRPHVSAEAGAPGKTREGGR
jgi:hypothetical protein